WRGDLVGVRYLIGPAATVGYTGDVARTDDRGQDQRIHAVVLLEWLDHVHRDLDRLARRDVGDVLGEHIGPLLLEQAGRAALGLGVRVGLSRVLQGLHAAADLERADLKPVVVD